MTNVTVATEILNCGYLQVGFLIVPHAIPGQGVSRFEPGYPLTMMKVELRGKITGVIKGADKDLYKRAWLSAIPLPSQWRTALVTECALHPR